nr:reverse transcriptase domain-containing protein [Tanacetum cinerariifolium]
MCEMVGQFIQKKQEEKRIEEEQYGDEHLNTILATELDKFIKSCVENLVPNPSESEGENDCDVPASFTTFSNVLFDAEYEFDSSDDQSLSDEDFPEKIFSNPLFEEEIIPMKIDQHHFNAESDLIKSLLNHDSFIIPSSLKIDSLLDEFAGELTLLKSIPSGIDKNDCYHEKEIRLTKRLLYDNLSPHPPKEFVFENSNADIESFSPSPIPVEDSDSHMEEINLFFTLDDPMPSGIKEDDDDYRRDILIREELLDNYSLSLPVIESFYFDIPSFSRPPAKPPDELHQLDTFYNALNPNDQDALDLAAGGNFLDKIPRECLSIIKSKSKVKYSRSRVTDVRANKNAPLSSSSHSNSFDLQQIVKQDDFQNQMMQFMQDLYNKPSTSSSLPSNTIPNPKGEAKAITTRSGMSYKEPPIPPTDMNQQELVEVTTDTEPQNSDDIHPLTVQAEVQADKPPEEPTMVIPKAKANLPYPSRLQKEKL